MLIFQPIRTIANIIPLNQRFRALYDQVNALTERVAELEGATAQEKQSVPEKPSEPEVFDWRTTTDVDALKEYAQKTYGFNSRKRKVDAVRAEMIETLEL